MTFIRVRIGNLIHCGLVTPYHNADLGEFQVTIACPHLQAPLS